MSERPSPSAEELAAFHEAIDGVVPLRTPERVAHEPPKPAPRPRQRELDDIAVVHESLYGPFEIDDLLAIGDADSYLRAGVSRNVLKDLRRGRWSIQNHIDLHGLNRHEAHDAVARFLAESLQADKRCLRIVHGRGYGSPGREGILRQFVKSWLSRRKDVLAFCHAPSFDGGEGALWVLLRSGAKPRAQS
jgi:DNA-nicking Smr family endonuclease